ncbi:Mitochondrial uncoupling protein 1, variant 3 [Lathyrus oleraceus]|uniref:Mitochondrial uncoupling protein 1, variant 3 n=2 Tax=Pisum sativum TaxID=3888 RepID=A0A9D4XE28_PEA|nr:Mitochondrial uncoupling protein 1, variant 3 [Pisum sativum]
MSAMVGGGGSNSDISFAGTFASSAFSACFAKTCWSPPSSFLTLHFLPIPILSPQFLKVFGRNNMGSKAPSWSDQWGNGGLGSDEYEDDVMVKKNNKSNGSGKMADAKAMASVSMGKAKTVAIVGADKAKSAAVVGAQKVKSGTSAGFIWIKNQCQKKK